jgi:serine-type D-Ala-D-Ala carboxypeptidase/endopeptidase
MPAKAGIQASGKVLASLDSRFRGNDDVGGWRGFFHTLFRGNDTGREAAMRVWRWAGTVLGLMLLFTPPAQAESVLQESIGLAGPAMWIVSGAPGMVLVVVRGDDTVIEGYGETAKGNKHEPDAHSLFRLASITKVFTTEVLGSMVADGQVRLTDKLQAYAGEAKVPSRDGRDITLLDLATHTAGLPREMGEAPDGAAQFTWPTRSDRWAWLAKETLGWAPGTVAAYSNIGFDLLADALETAAHKPYPEMLRERVTTPLGMTDTGFAPTPEQCQRLMIGSGLAPAAPCVDTHATEGSGGLYSTGADMARWLRHNLDDDDPALLISHAVYRQRQALPAAIGFDEAGPMSGLGLGWVVMAGHGTLPTIVAKSGGGAGFMTYIAFAPGRHVGVFVAVSRVDFAMFHGMTQGANDLIANLTTR